MILISCYKTKTVLHEAGHCHWLKSPYLDPSVEQEGWGNERWAYTPGLFPSLNAKEVKQNKNPDTPKQTNNNKNASN